tara:strand:- start:9203 stop:10369 length:1167 start_codon:yes stop_codon:yes gene_type:complete
MSGTKLLKTDSPSSNGDAVSKQPDRLLSWFSGNRWYLVATLLVLILARSEAKWSETPAMQRNRKSIEEMSRVERDRLRYNHEQYQKLSRQQLERVRTIHDVAQKDSQFDRTISEFHSWLATLSLTEREELLATSNVEDRLQAIRRLKVEASAPSINKEFKPSFDNATRNQLTNLRVPPRDYERMMRAAAEWSELEASPTAKSQLGLLEHHSFVLASIMDKVLPGWRMAASRSGNRTRPLFPDELRLVLLEQLTDPNMKRVIQSRPQATQNMMAMMLLARGLFDETNRVAQSLNPTDDDLERVLRNLPETRRKFIGDLPEEIGNRYLQQMWVTRKLSPDAADSLSKLSSLFERLLNRPPIGQGTGIAPNRQRFDAGGVRPADRPDGKRR